MANLQELQDMANKIRLHCITATQASNSGHPTSCSSCTEILSVLFFDVMCYDVKNPRDPSSDRFVLSKGHACPALYAVWAELGLFPSSDLLNLRKVTSDLEGHPTPRLDFVDVATGSLGQGLSCAAGMAWVAKYLDKASYKVYCLLGDGETAEGSVYEALNFSSHYKLDNLVAVVDVNRLGQSSATAYEHDLDNYRRRFEACGWQTIVVDGHNVEALSKVLRTERQPNTPMAIIAKTFKGNAFPGIENRVGFHGKPLGGKAEEVLTALQEQIVNKGQHKLTPAPPGCVVPAAHIANLHLPQPPNYTHGDMVAMRDAYASALIKLGGICDRVIAMDGDMKNSTFSDKFEKMFPDRFIECYIAEQNMVGAGIGAATRGRAVVFMSSFAAFFSRANDQIRMGAVSFTDINICGSHCGVSIGPDGPSQMALEDLAFFRTLPGCTVFYPSDAVSMERAVELCANTKGMCYIRMTRPATQILYASTDTFTIGKAKVVRKSESDQVTVVASGVPLCEAMKAAEQLAQSGVNVRIIDPFTIKPLDVETILKNARETGGRILVVEDHYPQGGVGDAVAAGVALYRDISVYRVAIESLPRSGSTAELLSMYKIDSAGISEHINTFLSM